MSTTAPKGQGRQEKSDSSRRGYGTCALVGILIAELALPLWPGLGNLAFAASTAAPRTSVEASAETTAPSMADAASWRTAVSQAFADDPVHSWLRSMPTSERERPLYSEGTLDPSLVDEDPFFLRSQAWVSAAESTDDDIPVLGLPHKILRLSAPLTPIFVGDAYTVLTGKPGSALASSDGVFLINTRELITAAANEAPVAIFYFPLPEGRGLTRWTKAHELPANDIFVFTDNHGTSIPVELSDMDAVVTAERVTLTLAMAEGARSWARGQLERDESTRLLPPRGSTAGHGVLFLGQGEALRGRAFSLYHSDRNYLYPTSHVKEYAAAFAQTLLDAFSPPSAHAEITILTAEAGARMSAQIIRFAVVSTLALVASVALKYTVYRKTFENRRRCEQALTTGDATLPALPLSLAGRALREGKEIGDVYAHTLTVLYQLPAVWFANQVEFLGDRAAPKLTAASNSKMRKLLEHTVYFSREVSRRIPVSAWTWFMGGLVLGGVDTALYYAQLYHLVPAIADGIGQVFPFLRSRIEEAYAVGNPNTEALNRYALIACGISYFTSGASTMSTSVQSQMLDAATTEVDEEMKREGLDPEDIQFEADRARRIQAKLDRALRAMGLPGREAFLFDAQTIWEGITGLLGYRLPDGVRDNADETERNLGLRRPGLVISALTRAVADARRRQRETLATGGAIEAETGATAILTETLNQASWLQNFIKTPLRAWLRGEPVPSFRDALIKLRAARQNLIALSYEDPSGKLLKNLPDGWGERFGRAGSELAAKLYRAQFLTLMSGEEHAPHIIDGAPLPTENYQPAKHGVVARWQERRAARHADVAFAKETQSAFDAQTASAEERAQWERHYAEAIMDAVGLYPDFAVDDAMRKQLHERARAATTRQMAADESLARHMAGLAREDRDRLSALIYAENSVQIYLSLTANNESLSPLSPAQPGRLQRLRQHRLVRNSAVLTRAARGVEALFGDNSYRLGGNALLDRSVPGWAEFRLSNARAYRFAFTGAAAYYPFNSLVWGITLSPAMWTLNLISRFTITAPEQFLNRFFRMQGLKPMSKISSMVLFGVIYSFATFWGSIPMQIFANDFLGAWSSLGTKISTILILLRHAMAT